MRTLPVSLIHPPGDKHYRLDGGVLDNFLHKPWDSNNHKRQGSDTYQSINLRSVRPQLSASFQNIK
ncbi:hypothetical protein L798_02697 [Zootermopsis nevadensis]|uniref:Uncharacterized protein n=1 Tax=Zootermopsis nevadensis TaxID=136037 RepID=A0A067RMD3_ZOONE|nr:hypothetical protein L798_02697 [Zootermopsis nevadensis]